MQRADASQGAQNGEMPLGGSGRHGEFLGNLFCRTTVNGQLENLKLPYRQR
jgi:hypothetical protein